MIELFGKLSLGIPAVIVVIFLVFWLTGGLDEKVETPIIDDVPEVPTITLPTEEEVEIEVDGDTPLCEEFLYVNLHTNGMLIYEGLLNCHLIGVYTEDPNVIVTYPHITIQTLFDANTNGWQQGYNA